MWPLSAVQFNPVERPCFRRWCPNGLRLDQREITRMMSLFGTSRQFVPSWLTVAIGAKRTSVGTGADYIGRE